MRVLSQKKTKIFLKKNIFNVENHEIFVRVGFHGIKSENRRGMGWDDFQKLGMGMGVG